MHAAIPALQNCRVSEKLKTLGICCSTATPSSRATLILAMFILIRKKKKRQISCLSPFHGASLGSPAHAEHSLAAGWG